MPCFFSLFFLFCAVSLANVCTPLNLDQSQLGPWQPIVNGVDHIGPYSARILWTSDATAAMQATNQAIRYATEAEWAAHAESYPHIFYTVGAGLTPANSRLFVQGGPLLGLVPDTTYYYLPVSTQGGATCTLDSTFHASDLHFHTASAPATVLPALPSKAKTPEPALKGTHFVYGENCGGAPGSDPVTVTNNFQDCLMKAVLAHNNADIALRHGVTYPISQFYLPQPYRSMNLNCSSATDRCTFSGAAPANGSQCMIYAPPAPINAGAVYNIIHATANSFQLSHDGVHPIKLTTSTTTAIYKPYPTSDIVTLHSDAAADLLPPPGVRLGPSDMAQYLPNMPILESVDPLEAMIQPGNGGGWVFKNIAFATSNEVYTTSARLGGETHPVGYVGFFGLERGNDTIAFEQVAFMPKPPPSKSFALFLSGKNIGFYNSTMGVDWGKPGDPQYGGFEWWQVHYTLDAGQPDPSFTAHSIKIPASTFSWVGEGGPVGMKKQCHNDGGTYSVTGIGTGNYAIWMNAQTCQWMLDLPQGMSATFTTGTNMAVKSEATPAFPKYLYHSIVYPALTKEGFTVLNWNLPEASTISGGAITSLGIDTGYVGEDYAHKEGGGGIEGDVFGPLTIDNSFLGGAGLMGVYTNGDIWTQNTPCGAAATCQAGDEQADLTITRVTVTTNPCYLYTAACWNGGNYNWRNAIETKWTHRMLVDGSVIGPTPAQVGAGQCSLHEAFAQAMPAFGSPAEVDSSEYTFTNNTCVRTSAGMETYISYAEPAGPAIENILIQNNLFIDNNSYAINAGNQPWSSPNTMPGFSAHCPHGALAQLSNVNEVLFNHNTVFGQGGCFSAMFYFDGFAGSGIRFTNNILEWVPDNNVFAPYTKHGIWAAGLNVNHPCGSSSIHSGLETLGCSTGNVWAGNVVVPTYLSSSPANLAELSSENISAWKPNLPKSNVVVGATLAARRNSIGWLDYSHSNFRLKSDSAYSAGNVRRLTDSTTDGMSAGVNQDELEQHQGKVSRVRVVSSTSDSATIGFYAPDSFACSVDWGTTAFYNGGGRWKRVRGAAGSSDPREQTVMLNGLPAHGTIFVKVNCAVEQPTVTAQLP